MNENKYDSIALREVYIILEKLDMLNKIPPEFLEYIQKEQDVNHSFDFNENRRFFGSGVRCRNDPVIPHILLLVPNVGGIFCVRVRRYSRLARRTRGTV